MADVTLTLAAILGPHPRPGGRETAGPVQVAHLARATLDTRRPAHLHDHDFFELIWVQNGHVRHHLPDAREDLAEGDLIFIRPADRHALQGRGDAAMVVSIAFEAGLIAAIGLRHPALAAHLFWSPAPRPARKRHDPRQLAALNHAALRLERGPRDALAAEALLLPLCAELVGAAPALPAEAPDWLVAACTAAQDPAVFRDGAAGLVRAAGRAHPHVSRTMRRLLDRSPSDYVNALRMDFAARRLTGAGDSLAEIAADCGIPNLSHFHKLFRAHHGLTPADYRRRFQSDLIQPR